MIRKLMFTAALFVLLAGGASNVFAGQAVGDIPIQHHGRVKPFLSFAREALQFISGKTSWQGQDAVDVLVAHMDKPQEFLGIPFILVEHKPLKDLLGLAQDQKNFSYEQLKASFHTLSTLVQGSDEKRGKDVRPTPIEQQAETLYQRVMMVERLSSGELITVIPVVDGAWMSPYKAANPQSEAFKQLARDCAAGSPACIMECAQWIDQTDALIGKGARARVDMESLYYNLQPFFCAWMLYLFGFLCLLCPHAGVKRLGRFSILAGFVFHSAGLLLRALVLLRPPVANMYETMIFMDWVLMLCVGVFVVLKKREAFLSSGALVSALVMLYARLLPVDQSLDVLSPVLRSSFWLTIHVITIVSSYSFFAFAMAVSHRHLFLSAQGKQTPQEEQVSADTIYRLLQIGLIALGAGTVLGGIWANEAWGRFWGWDPKETWAFITFLGYMTILHLRYRKILNNFGLAVGGILGFLLVVMTWYGVNFVLGRGLHSYGAGSGGLTWIIYFLVVEAVFLGFVFYRRKA